MQNKNDNERKPKIVLDVHFVWVDQYEGSNLRGHWLSISHPQVVRVFEPHPLTKEDGEWMTILYKPGVFIPPSSDDKYDAEMYLGTERIAWREAVNWAKRPVS